MTPEELTVTGSTSDGQDEAREAAPTTDSEEAPALAGEPDVEGDKTGDGKSLPKMSLEELSPAAKAGQEVWDRHEARTREAEERAEPDPEGQTSEAEDRAQLDSEGQTSEAEERAEPDSEGQTSEAEERAQLDSQGQTSEAEEDAQLEPERQPSAAEKLPCPPETLPQQRDSAEQKKLLSQWQAFIATLEALAVEQRAALVDQTRQLMDERASAFRELQSELVELRSAEEERLNETLNREWADLQAKQEAVENQIREIEQTQQDLDEQRRNISSERRKLEMDREILAEDREAFEAKVEGSAAARIQRMELEKSTVEAKLQALRSHFDELQARLAEREEEDRKAGHLSRNEMFRRVERLRREKEELQRKLAARPSSEDMQRLRELEGQLEDYELDRADLSRQLQEAKRRLGKYQSGCVELETLRDQKAALEASNNLLRDELKRLGGRIKRTIDERGRTSFSRCLQMDDCSALQMTIETDAAPLLASLVQEVQDRMANGSAHEEKLRYYLEDIRSFLAGLAASYLTILQGISGTGKTSLPKAFASAVGGGWNVIEVQAGWRDRADLIGHYNTFEGEFHEQKFLRALYRAQCPAYEDRLFLVVLDEMNLSYVEQYFADLISALEQPESDPELELMTGVPAGESVPRLLIKKGCSIRIPSNVRFIGTANQDETTKDIADKTYDRAHILELPSVPPTLRPSAQSESPRTISYRSLKDAFDEAKNSYSAEAERSYSFLKAIRDAVVAQRFGVVWGSRLRSQVEDYVPVVLAAGGSIGEATDYVLAFKILRKIRDRFAYTPQDYQALEKELMETWPQLDQKHTPGKSLKIIEQELARSIRQSVV